MLALRGLVMLPNMVLHFDIGRKKSIAAIEAAMKSSSQIFMVCQNKVETENPTPKDLYTVGTIGSIRQIINGSDGFIKVMVKAENRAKVKKFINGQKFLKAEIEFFGDISTNENKPLEVEALMRNVKGMYHEYLELTSKVPPDLMFAVEDMTSPSELSDYITANSNFKFKDKQKILEEFDSVKRLQKLFNLLSKELQIGYIEQDLYAKLRESLDDTQKEIFLREQMKVISRELGDRDDPEEESAEYKKKIKKLHLPEEVEEKLLKECKTLDTMPYFSSEANTTITYLDTCLALPWNKRSKDNLDIKKAEKILNRDHFGLTDVKERIVELLAVKNLTKDAKGQIICLLGPPGVGKTSIAKSLAEAMNRKYVRVALGGVKDESEIRGHRKTYVGAMPGRIISAIKRAGTKNPLILLDEIDKLSKDYYGDPSAALLEALDSEQNSTFYDHYIDVPFDLSEVMFIATANDRNSIPKPLYDRMEVIELYSYTHEEKFQIAKRHLLDKQLAKNGLNKRIFKITDKAIHDLVEFYTKEAGVRELERQLGKLMMKSAKNIVSNQQKKVSIDQEAIVEMLGPHKYKKMSADKHSTIGVVQGLAWTSVGGETMPIEVALMKGKGKVNITGSLGDVMKESAQIAVSYIRSNSEKLGINKDFYHKFDIHIHAPEGAIPKDGPSAGVTMTTALVSALSNVPVKQNLAMTGEVTLKGRVLAIGGLKEKTMAAYRDGVKTVIIPSENESDLQKIDDTVKKSIKFIMADNLETVLNNALDRKLKS